MEIKYRPEIDGLRTIAVLSVIIYHGEFVLGAGQLLKGGFLGVDVFFVISGFLITSLIMSEYQREGHFSFANFYERRARRLLPALLVVMAASSILAWKYLLPTQLIDFSSSIIASLLFGSNFYWYETLQQYGGESALLKPFLHTWSLAVEEQYYIIFPLVLIAIYRWWKNHTIVLLSAGLLLSLQFSAWITPSNPSFSFYMLASRFWELLIGGLLANVLYLHPQKDNDALLNRTMPVLGLFLIVHSLIFIDLESGHPGFITLFPAIGTILIIWFSNRNDLVTKVLSSRVFVGIGLISYSLYLWHYPIFAFGRIMNMNPSFYDKSGWIALTFMLSVATYYLVERPFRNRKWISRKALLASMLLGMGIIGTASWYSLQENGHKDRFPYLVKIYGKNEFDNKILQSKSWSILNDLAEAKGYENSRAHGPSVFEANHSWFSMGREKTNVLVIGNSHAKDLFNALYLNREQFSNYEFARFGMHGNLLEAQVDSLLSAPNFQKADIILISFRYSDNTVNRLPELIGIIKNKDKKILLTSNTVEFELMGAHPVFDWYVRKYGKEYSSHDLKEYYFQNRSRKREKANKLLRQIAAEKDVAFLDNSQFICNEELKICDGITREGYKSFYDYGHFTLEGAKYFGARIHEIDWLGLN